MVSSSNNNSNNNNSRLAHLQSISLSVSNNGGNNSSSNNNDDLHVLHDYLCVWGHELTADELPEALESLGVTARHWENLAAAYNPIALHHGKRWQRFSTTARQVLVCLWAAFLFLLVSVWYIAPNDNHGDDDDRNNNNELLQTLATLGWFPLYGVTVITNIICSVARKRILENPMQKQVVNRINQEWNNSNNNRRLAVPVRLQLYMVTTCRQEKLYYLSFLFRRQQDNGDAETVATDAS